MIIIMKREELSSIIAEAVRRIAPDSTVTPDISYADAQFGDYATNVAFKLAKELKQAPRAIAEQIAEKVADPRVKSATAVNGFINITVQPQVWIDVVTEISENYATSQIGNGKKIQVEFISANPTGPLTIANGRGGFLGDVLANVLSHTGHEAVREYYINDAGNQIMKLVDAIKDEAGLPIADERQYSGSYIKDLVELIKPTADMPDELIRKQALEEMLGLIRAAVERMGIRFDVWFSENTLIEEGAVSDVLDVFKKKGLLYEKDGAIWLKSESFGDDRDRVMLKQSGEPVYLLGDIAYHEDILVKRSFDTAIKIWGSDHAGQVPSLKLSVAQITEGQLDFILLQMVRIIKDGKEFKSSKRAGTYITTDELFDAVGDVDVVRWFFLMRSPDAQMDFDIDLAQQQSQANPFYYVMYSYARANSILAQAAERGIEVADMTTELSDAEIALIRHMSRLPLLVEEVAASYAVHKLVHYALEVAQLFHDLYESEKIVDLAPERASQRLYVITQYVTFMTVVFNLVGVTPQAKMVRKSVD